MYENLKEIAAHKKRVWSKVVVPEKLFSLVGYCVESQGSNFFQGTVFLYLMKVAAAIHFSMDTVFFRTALAAINCVYTMYLTGIEKVLS